MPHIILTEKIHHGRYINRRSAVVKALTQQSIAKFQSGSPYGAVRSHSRLKDLVDVLTRAEPGSKAEHGWADYKVFYMPENAECFERECGMGAEGYVLDVDAKPEPVCADCATRLGRDIKRFGEVQDDLFDITEHPRFTPRVHNDGDPIRWENDEWKGILSAEPQTLWAVREPSPEDPNRFRVTPGTSTDDDVLYTIQTIEPWQDMDKELAYVY